MEINIDSIFTDTEFEELKELAKTLEYRPITRKNYVLWTYANSIFKTASHIPTPNKFTDKIKDHFKINLNLQSWYFVEYQEGAFVTPHKHENVHSLISTTTLISELNEFKGGNFYINEYANSESPYQRQKIKIKTNETLLIPGDALHSVTKVTEGIRIALITWWGNDNRMREIVQAVHNKE